MDEKYRAKSSGAGHKRLLHRALGALYNACHRDTFLQDDA